MAVVAYSDNFNKMINLAVRLNDSFKRLKYAQEKSGKRVRNPFYKKERNLNAIN